MLEVKNLFKTYEGKLLLTDISFTVAKGETICLLGASGSGKSTLLRMIAGLELLDSGFVSFDGLDLVSTPPHLRDFGLVFQDYALFPHLNVNDNVAFGLKMRRIEQGEISKRVANSLELVSLKGFEQRGVNELSGGEQQRVALARALAIRPRLLMFDEPLGALDRSLREDLLNELRTILHQTKIPAIYVTHDQEEAFAITDRVLILSAGRIIREGTPVDVWANPQSAFVAEFLGLGNIFAGKVIAKNKFQTKYGVFTVNCSHKHSKGDKAHLLARPFVEKSNRWSSKRQASIPHDRRTLPAAVSAGLSSSKPRPDGTIQNAIRGIVTDIVFQQDTYKVIFDNGLYVYLSAAPKVGKKIAVRVKVECLR